MFLGTRRKSKCLGSFQSGRERLVWGFTMHWSTVSLKLPRLYKARNKAFFALTSQAHKHFNELFLHGSLGSYQATIIQITTPPHPARSWWLRFSSFPNANWNHSYGALIKHLTVGAWERLLPESARFWDSLFKSWNPREIWLSSFQTPDDVSCNTQGLLKG